MLCIAEAELCSVNQPQLFEHNFSYVSIFYPYFLFLCRLERTGTSWLFLLRYVEFFLFFSFTFLRENGSIYLICSGEAGTVEMSCWASAPGGYLFNSWDREQFQGRHCGLAVSHDRHWRYMSTQASVTQLSLCFPLTVLSAVTPGCVLQQAEARAQNSVLYMRVDEAVIYS